VIAGRRRRRRHWISGQSFGVDGGLYIPAQPFSVATPPLARHNHPLANWLEHLTVVRNICAHHGRR
jgi:hypothetical protein